MIPKDVFEALWERVSDDGVDIEWRVPSLAQEADVNGCYLAPSVDGGFPQRPRIVLFREKARRPQYAGEPDFERPLEDVCTLAHEHGHYLSDEARQRNAAYVAAVKVPLDHWPGLPEATKLLIFEEEQRAWNYGRLTLTDLGFEDWGAFDERERADLATYERLLQLKR
jgi:hypothetical protein